VDQGIIRLVLKNNAQEKSIIVSVVLPGFDVRP
jgi:hypothetical protein